MPELYFKGKEFVYNHHLTVPYRPLQPDTKKSIGEQSENLIIHGDNLHALKALLPRYAGKVDCIFIDPPYNTGNENWSYNDNVNSPLMKEWLDGNPVNKDDMLRNDKWLCLMWPRLKLLYELLSESGTIWISIDDIEVAKLRLIMDEIFGDSQLIAQLVWKSRVSEDTRSKTGISVDHEYIIGYSKSLQPSLRGVEKDIEKFSNPDNDPRGPWRSADLTGLADKKRRPNLHYDLINPSTRINYGCPPKGWRYERDEMRRRISDGRILWPSSPDGRPRHKVFLAEMRSNYKSVTSILDFVSTADGTRELDAIIPKSGFDFPKPSRLIQFLIEQALPDDGLILAS